MLLPGKRAVLEKENHYLAKKVRTARTGTLVQVLETSGRVSVALDWFFWLVCLWFSVPGVRGTMFAGNGGLPSRWRPLTITRLPQFT